MEEHASGPELAELELAGSTHTKPGLLLTRVSWVTCKKPDSPNLFCDGARHLNISTLQVKDLVLLGIVIQNQYKTIDHR